ncbi:MAG TPA: hypothetical protein VHR27_03645 [Blastocatellia bacterium]|nr:hypothetical protein [Blastocatellia bacterium]
MNYHTLQKLMVRMLFDEELVEEVYAAPDRALAGLDLTESERSQLLSVDPRAWRSDALRRRRTLRTVVEEYKISTTIILAETRSLASLERFFSSQFWRRSVEERGSMGLAFAEFLLDGSRCGEWNAPQIPDVVRLEAAIAGCRRTLASEGNHEAGEFPAAISDRMRVKLAPGHDVASFQANVIETIQHVEQYLFELSLMPAMALCDDAPRLSGLPEVNVQKKVYLLFGPGAAGISITNLDKSDFLVLYEAKRAVEIRSLLSRLAPARARQAQDIVSEWLENGALMILEGW